MAKTSFLKQIAYFSQGRLNICLSYCMKTFAEKLYKSKQWQRCRESYMKSVGYLCEDCLKQGRYTAAEEVHHIIFLTPDNVNDPNITLNWNNLVALCRECHRARHRGQQRRRYVIDEMGNATPI